jgi:hypothetical protein
MGTNQEMGTLSGAKRKLLESILRGEVKQTHPRSILTPRSGGAPAPLSLMQEQLWLLETTSPSIPPLYNESITLRMKGHVDLRVLGRSLAEVIRRHEIWRTTYETVGGKPVQRVHAPAVRFPLQYVDLRRFPSSEREVKVHELGKEQCTQRFDLQAGPLLRATLVALSDGESWLVMAAHQSIVDGVSVYQLFPSELRAIYNAFYENRPCPLPDLKLQFSDFAVWQRAWLASDERGRQLAYWRAKLSSPPPVLHWPDNKPRPPRQSFRGHIRSFLFPADVAEGIRAVAQRWGTTRFVVLLAASFALLQRYSGQSDLVLGTFSPAGRKRSEVQELLGYFLNPVSLRIDVSDDPTFIELTRRVQETLSEAMSNDDVPFEHIVAELKPLVDASRNPYFTVAVSLQPPMADLGGSWSITSMDAESGGAKLDLYIAFIDRPEGLHARFQYNPDIFEFADIFKIVDDLQVLLGAVASDSDKRISEFEV